jgi:hypothetical protein
MSDEISDFDAAKSISDVLKGMEKERQQRVLRWVAESLDIAVHVRPAAAHDIGHVGSSDTGVGAQATASAAAASRQPVDIKTFVESKSPKSDIQFATVVAYYYRFVAQDNREAISSEILQNATRLVGRSRFATPVMTLNNAKKQGYLDTAERGTFRINSVGENLVAMTLPGTDGGARAKPRKRTMAKKPSSKQRQR